MQLLRRFISGDIDAHGEAELDRRAKQDDFLADAMSGLRSAPTEDHAAALERMRRRLPAREAKRRPIGFFQLAAVASVALLIAVAVFLLPEWMSSTETVAMEASRPESTITAPVEAETALELQSPSSAPELKENYSAKKAAEKQKAQKAAAAEAEKRKMAQAERELRRRIEEVEFADASVEEDLAVAADEIEEAPRVSALPPPPPPPPPAVQEAPPVVAYGAPAPTEKTAAAAPPAPATYPQSYGAEEERVQAKRRAFSTEARMETLNRIDLRRPTEQVLPAGFQLISGYVTDENDQPISGANVHLPGQPLGEQTDAKGYFELLADQSVRQIIVDHPEHQNAEVSLPRGEKEVQVNLESIREPEDDEFEFNGAISTYYPNLVPSAAAPVEKSSREIRREIIANKPANLNDGKVRVSFSVQKDGSLTDFSLSGRSDDALRRYVRQSLQQTKWKLIRGGEEPARIYLVFNFK